MVDRRDRYSSDEEEEELAFEAPKRESAEELLDASCAAIRSIRCATRPRT